MTKKDDLLFSSRTIHLYGASIYFYGKRWDNVTGHFIDHVRDRVLDFQLAPNADGASDSSVNKSQMAAEALLGLTALWARFSSTNDAALSKAFHEIVGGLSTRQLVDLFMYGTGAIQLAFESLATSFGFLPLPVMFRETIFAMKSVADEFPFSDGIIHMYVGNYRSQFSSVQLLDMLRKVYATGDNSISDVL